MHAGIVPRLTPFLKALALLMALVPPSARAGTGEAVSSFELDNGLKIVVIEDHRAPVVTHMLWYRVGAADEPPGKSGIAHFLEHLMFKGTDKVGDGEFSRIVEANGGSDNAFTSQDYTAYFQRIAADRLELMMTMEADRMRNLRLDPAVVETERDVILEERNQRTENNPGALLREQLEAALYLNHPYGIPVIGWKHEMQGLTREDALAFYRRYYAPNNAVLVVAGDVSAPEVLAMARRIYGPIAPTVGLGPRQRPQEPPQRAERRVVLEDQRVSTPYVLRTYLAPERDPGDQRKAAALTLFAELLGGSGLTSFLGQELQLKRNIAVNTSAFYSGLSLDDTEFGVLVVPRPGISLAEAEAALDKSIGDFLERDIDPDHLARIKAQIRAQQIYARDSLSGLARRYGAALTSGLTVQDVQDWPDILNDITPQEILAAGREVLDRRHAVTAWLQKPQAEEDK